MIQPSPADDRAAQAHEGLVDVVSFVEAGAEPAELVQQGDRLLDDATLFTKAAAVGGPPAGDERLDAAVTQPHAVRVGIITTVGDELPGRVQRGADLATDGWDGVDQRDQLCDVVVIGGGQQADDRDAAGVDQQVVLGSRLAAVGGIGPRFFPPCTARTDDESAMTREKSIRSAPRSLASSNRCNARQASASRQSRRRFQRVMPQQPISWGKSSQGMPVLRTKRIPVRQTRLSTGGWPPLGLGVKAGSSGSTSAQRSSSTSNLAIGSSSVTSMRLNVQAIHRINHRAAYRYF
jgi:hypothetical protein